MILNQFIHLYYYICTHNKIRKDKTELISEYLLEMKMYYFYYKSRSNAVYLPLTESKRKPKKKKRGPYNAIYQQTPISYQSPKRYHANANKKINDKHTCSYDLVFFMYTR